MIHGSFSSFNLKLSFEYLNQFNCCSYVPGASTGARGFVIFRTSFLGRSGDPRIGTTLFLPLLLVPLPGAWFTFRRGLTSFCRVFPRFLFLVWWFLWTFRTQRILGSTLGYSGSTRFGRPLFFKLYSSFGSGFVRVIIVEISGHLCIIVIEITRSSCVRFGVCGFALWATSCCNGSWFANTSTGRNWLATFTWWPGIDILSF